ncbi:hypothetical protein GGI04_002622 [Coemansia thaxteri]|uniref:Uncharacterized protein n=1 Tax=Coemansia thaxteri TaxID=2663907 RepID=A0A9W8EJZ9_9FUNG|nr:hypothetical protein H4R26_002594 [Coemansia thaxteri]KAJ2004388.1 hypothetical protein GGI04_002622 [Coemansia thaxteri]KAJ2472017.1 hypothetical protein GGI02_001882 [Coemansia sp. RSA 2322]KAJ2484745.1 hypothetical protein EV174_002195 [Coemansia sp. RSA 2320]
MRIIGVCAAALSLALALPTQLDSTLGRRAGELEAAIYDETSEAVAMDPNVAAALEGAEQPLVLQQAALGYPAYSPAPVQPALPAQPMFAAPLAYTPQPLPPGNQAPIAQPEYLVPASPFAAGYGDYPALIQPPPIASIPPPAIQNAPYPAAPQPAIPAVPDVPSLPQYVAPQVVEEIQPEVPAPPPIQPVAQPIVQPAARPVSPPNEYAWSEQLVAPPMQYPPPAAPGPVPDYQIQTGIRAGSKDAKGAPAEDEESGSGSFNPIGNLFKGISNGLGSLFSGLGAVANSSNDPAPADDLSAVAQPYPVGQENALRQQSTPTNLIM